MPAAEAKSKASLKAILVKILADKHTTIRYICVDEDSTINAWVQDAINLKLATYHRDATKRRKVAS